MITGFWLAEHACIKLHGFPLQTNFEKEYQKRIASEFATKHSILVVKQKDFSDQKCIDWQPEKVLSGEGWCRTKYRVTELHGRQTES